MKNPAKKHPPESKDKSKEKPGINILDLLGKTSSTAKAVVDLLSAKETTKQVVTECDTRIIEAFEKTTQTRIGSDVRILDIEKSDEKDQRRHKEEMTKLWLHAKTLGIEQDLHHENNMRIIELAESGQTKPPTSETK